jgi:hypothetical protein
MARLAPDVREREERLEVLIQALLVLLFEAQRQPHQAPSESERRAHRALLARKGDWYAWQWHGHEQERDEYQERQDLARAEDWYAWQWHGHEQERDEYQERQERERDWHRHYRQRARPEEVERERRLRQQKNEILRASTITWDQEWRGHERQRPARPLKRPRPGFDDFE